jgi:hypothetical protein
MNKVSVSLQNLQELLTQHKVKPTKHSPYFSKLMVQFVKVF